ncbi:APC family permease [Psychroserpens sp. NJDZ02]|uniref:APC family permease n=1 Tax=Psychroserpens sp. NJDZ02 TaxID=2570561 RepID=UPI0010A77F33|nr:APC family permease [Psychroserpens sp. NJDZ02]QCE40475.1 APC family permease [Psychroserpens sp. NJDZ02]
MKKHKKLSELAATAISGNDISSSVLYVSALAIAFAGQYAWITLLIVSLVLFLFRKIYGEVVGALPLNGGAYNALLNTTSKFMASFAATLTLLSYMATAVISANEAIHYLHHIVPSISIIMATIILLSFFGGLTIVGVSESSKVAIGIFLFHLFSFAVLSGFIIFFLFNNGIGLFIENWYFPTTSGSITKAIFLGFAASMLGVSGFESSANFVEEQQKGVFPKTLKNMWVVVSILNPLTALFALSLFAIPLLQSEAYQNTLLIEMASHVGGNWLAILISVDAFLVLSGAVLTSFVGVSGLLERMALDRILPQFFLKKNKRGSSYRIIIVFLMLTISVLLITKGDVKLLAGVYTISFLSVMTLFGIGNVLLKVKRNSLPRPEKASWMAILVAITAVIIALIGNVVMPPIKGGASNVTVFLDYFIPAIVFTSIMLNRTVLLKFVLKIIHTVFDPVRSFVMKTDSKILNVIDMINSQEFVYFTKDDDVETLNKVLLYIQRNEHTKKLKVVTATKNGNLITTQFRTDIDVVDREYPLIKIEFVELDASFGPELITKLSKEWNIPINFMFIGSPGNRFPYKIEELGGVRLII